MRRVLLAGVSLTVTACAMSSSPPPAVSSRSTAPSPYVLALAETPGQCTLWREVAGQRQCLDGAGPAAPPAREAPPVAAPRMAVTAQQLDAPKPALLAPPAAMPSAAMPVAAQPAAAQPAAEDVGQQANLFEEMKRIGMIKASAAAPAAAGLPRLPAAGVAGESAGSPAGLPGLPRSSPIVLAAFEPAADGAARAFAATDPLPAPAPRGPAPRVAGAVTQSWATVEPPAAAANPALVQIAASTPQAHDTAGRAPVAAVEKAELPVVRANTVVPLKISEKATEDRPAVVAPAMPAPAAAARPVGGQIAQSSAPQAVAAPSLPALPALPALPGASAPTAASAPAAPTVVTAAPALPPVPTRVVPVSAPVAAPPLPPAAPNPPAPNPPAAAEPAPAKASPLARALGNSAPTPKPVAAPAVAKAKPAAPEHATKVAAREVPKSAAGKPGAGRYLVVQSFQERDRADRLAQRYHNLDAKVASVTIKGQTWHRVVVRDGATERSRLASDGLRGFWPVTL
ncbi:MAG: SPOR domain-containing protein [Alphaproteobacteria bacterium]|nr:SPOR domain-containing protein [Alphaproteobacteria bacterium]